MNCYICGDVAIKRHGYASLCDKHFRFRQMQKHATFYKKTVPSFYQLESMVPNDMVCRDCGCTMHWIDNENRDSGAVLQHYRDGTMAIVCNICNIRHGGSPGDTYRDVPHGHKLCMTCKTIKPLEMFSVRRDGKNPYPLSKCKACAHEAHRKWRVNNPEKYKAITKKHNDLRNKRLINNGAKHESKPNSV